VLIGPWNLLDEITTSLRSRGFAGDFITPLPVPRILAEVA
jgi:hypothetical protein